MALYDDLYRIARRSLLNQVSVTDRLIRQLYIRAAKSIAKQIETAKAGSLTERWLTAYKSALDAEIQRLGNGIYSAIERGAQRAAEARVECTAEYLRRACAAAGVDDSFTPTLASVPTDTLRAMIEGKLYTDGRMLSTRIWNEMGRLEGNIAEIIQQGKVGNPLGFPSSAFRPNRTGSNRRFEAARRPPSRWTRSRWPSSWKPTSIRTRRSR